MGCGGKPVLSIKLYLHKPELKITSYSTGKYQRN
jgi:hypothetical protein